MHNTNMIGARMVNDSLRTETNNGMKAMLMITVNKFAMYRLPISPHTKSGLLTNSSGPGRSPQMIIPPSRIAVVGEPGIPRVIMGSMEPVDAALLPASGAATPATLPLPKLSGSLLKVLVRPYAMSEAGVDKFIFTSSIAVYGDRADEADEETPEFWKACS